MELVNKKKSADESPPANKLMLESVNDSQTVQYYIVFLILTLTYTTYSF